MCIMHLHDEWTKKFENHFSATHVPTLRDAAFCHNSNRFLATRMRAEIAAGYCGEPTVDAFLKRVGSEYPQPRIKEGRRQLWLRDDLDRAIAPDIVPSDLAEDL